VGSELEAVPRHLSVKKSEEYKNSQLEPGLPHPHVCVSDRERGENIFGLLG
jgi:hypothetical protein